MELYWIEKDGKPVQTKDVLQWAKMFDAVDGVEGRRVGRDEKDDIMVSTVFLGLDHSFGYSPPLLYETTIFGGEHDEFQERYLTREEAKRGHKRACKLVGIVS